MSAVEFSPREWEVYASPDCCYCGGTGGLRTSEPRYMGWRWCDCAVANRERRIELDQEAPCSQQ